MKTFNILLLIVFFNTCYGQTYTFDKLVKNDFSTEFYSKKERSNLINSKDHSYRMMIYTHNDSLKSCIIDAKREEIHYFNIDRNDSLRLNFKKTKSFKKPIENFTYEFSEVKNRNNEIKLTIRNQKKRKIAKLKLTTQETDKNLFYIFKQTYSSEIYHFDNVALPFNFIVLKAKGTNNKGFYFEYTFKSIEEINISVSIP